MSMRKRCPAGSLAPGPSDVLRSFILSHRLSGNGLAVKAGIHASSINRWLSGRRSLSLAAFDQLSRVLGLTLVSNRRGGRAQAPRPPADPMPLE